MDARGIIDKLRLNSPLSAEEISWFANGLADGAVTDAQAGAFAMAVCLNGLGEDGRVHLTRAMRDSGDVLKWDLPGPVVDKHSTGGIGDCVSLPLAPALAACGAFVPMISGRGLGHTGGTLDKLEAIPGLVTDVGPEKFRDMVTGLGCAIVSAAGQMAPADKRLYAIRDVTSTVQSVDLITASILSKKLAAGLEGLVLDVKCGSGAFMKTRKDAAALAEALVKTANNAGCATQALVTDMSQPLAPSAGNAVEVADCMALLTEGSDGPLLQLTAAFGGVLLAASGLAEDEAVGRTMIRSAISSGDAAEVFGKMVAALGGPSDFVENWRTQLPTAPIMVPVPAKKGGFINAMQTEEIGLAVVHLGGGRLKGGQVIDPAVGLSDIQRLGAKVSTGDPIAMVHAADEDAAIEAVDAVQTAITIGAKPAPVPDLILESFPK